MKKFSILIICFIIFISCDPNANIQETITPVEESTPAILPLSSLFKVNLSGALGITSTSSSKKALYSTRTLSSINDISKILADGTLDEAVLTELDLSGGIGNILVDENNNTYICFEFGNNIIDGEGNLLNNWIQIIHIDSEGIVSAVWPPDYLEENSNQVAVTLIEKLKIFNNVLYFIADNAIYKYDPESADKKSSLIAKIPTEEDLLYYSFAINNKDQLLIVYSDIECTEFNIDYFVSPTESTRVMALSTVTDGTYSYRPYAHVVSMNDLFFLSVEDPRWEYDGLFTLTINNASDYSIDQPYGRFLLGNDKLYWELGNANYKNSALIIKNENGEHHWNDKIISNNVVDSDKLYSHMNSFYASSFSIKDGTVNAFNDSANFEGFVTQLSDFTTHQTFCETYFNGNLAISTDVSGESLVKSINSIQVLSSGIYGITCNSSSLYIVKLYNSMMEKDFTPIPLNSKIDLQVYGSSKVVDNFLYFCHAYPNNIDFGSYVSQECDFGRVEITTGNTEYFRQYIEKDLQVYPFDVDSNNLKYIFSGKDWDTGDTINGILDLTTKEWLQIDSNEEFDNIKIF